MDPKGTSEETVANPLLEEGGEEAETPEGQDEGQRPEGDQEGVGSPDEVELTEDLLEKVWQTPQFKERVGQATRDALQRQRTEAEANALTEAEEARIRAIEGIEDPEERTQKLAELGQQAIARQQSDRARAEMRQEYVSGLWNELRVAIPDIDGYSDEEKGRLEAAKTDGELISALIHIQADRQSASVLNALKAQANNAAAGKNREKPLALPGGSPGPASSPEDIKDPSALLAAGFAEALAEGSGGA